MVVALGQKHRNHVNSVKRIQKRAKEISSVDTHRFLWQDLKKGRGNF